MAADDLLVMALTIDGHPVMDEANGYEVVHYAIGGMTHKRVTLESDDIPGRVLLNWQPQVQLGDLRVLVRGANASQIGSRIDTLVGWSQAVDYLMVATVALPSSPGSTWVETWRCEPADWDRGALDAVALNNKLQAVDFTWPHSPIKV